jgi:hypothetical protein
MSTRAGELTLAYLIFEPAAFVERSSESSQALHARPFEITAGSEFKVEKQEGGNPLQLCKAIESVHFIRLFRAGMIT